MRSVNLALSIMLCTAMATGCAGTGMTSAGLTVSGPGTALMQQYTQTGSKSDVPVSPDDIRSGFFKIDDAAYQLPVSCQEFLNHGWTLDPAHSNKQLAPGDSLQTELRKGSGVLHVTIGNPGNERNLVTGLPVISLMILVYQPENSQIKLELPTGLILTADSFSYIVNAYGEAEESGASGPGNPYAVDEFTYRNPNDPGARVVINTDNGSGKQIRYVTFDSQTAFENKQAELIAAGTPIAEPTKEVAAYQVPTALGTDITSGIIEFEGDLYRLPVPVSALQKNGWKIHKSFPSELEPGGHQLLYMSRGSSEFDLFIVNPGTEINVHSNCFADRWDTNSKQIKTAGISVGDSRETLLTAINGLDYEYDPEWFYGEDQYLVNLGYSDDQITVTVSDETDKVLYIHIKKEQMNQ